MKYDRFEQLPVWQASIDLAVQVYAMTGKPVFRRQRSLRNQIEPACGRQARGRLRLDQYCRRFRARHESGAAYVSLYFPGLGRRSPLDALPARTNACLPRSGI